MNEKHTPKLSETAIRGARALQAAVRKDLEKKSKLGQYVIVSRNGETVRILASQVLAEAAEAKHRKKNANTGSTSPENTTTG